MKKFNKIIKSVISIAMALVFVLAAGCKADNQGDTATIVPRPPVEKVITLKQTSLDMMVGTTKLLEVDKYDRESANPITWSSDNEAIVSVNSQGYVEAKGEGVANVVVRQGELSASCQVTSTFGGMLAEVVLPVDDEFSIQKNKGFNLSPSIEFAGNTYYDGEFTYSISDQENFSIENGILTGLTSYVTTDVIIEGTWRGQTSDDMVTLRKTLTVSVIDSIDLIIEEYSIDYLELYTLPEFAGKTYPNALSFTPVVYVNDEIDQNAQVSVVPNDQKVVYDAENNQIIGKEFGDTQLTISYTSPSGNTIAETFDVTVLRPTSKFDKKIQYFSSYKGTLRDPADGFKNKTLVEYLYPGQDDVEICDAYAGDTQLTIDDEDRVFGITGTNTNAFDTTIVIGTKTSLYNVDMTVYGQYIYEVKDLDVFTRTLASVSYDGYVELGRDLDATGYKAGRHFDGETVATAVLPGYPSSGGGTFTGSAYFMGTFDGKGHTIDNLYIDYVNNSASEDGRFGMFCGVKNATIKNVAFTDVNFQGRSIFGCASENTTYENIYVRVDKIKSWYSYSTNVISYLPAIGGSLTNVYVEVPESIKTTAGSRTYAFSGALTGPTLRNFDQTVFNNCIVISYLPVSNQSRWGTEFKLDFGVNDTDEAIITVCENVWSGVKGGFGSNINKLYNELVAKDETGTLDPNLDTGAKIFHVGKAPRLAGVYRYNTKADFAAAASGIQDVISTFSTSYWQYSNGALTWK